MRDTTFSSAGGRPFTASIPLFDMGRAVREGIAAEGPDAWLRKLVSAYLRWYYAHPRPKVAREGATEAEIAREIVKRASARSALMGGATGAFTTATSLMMASSHGALGVAAIPAAVLAMGTDVLARGAVHLEMICDLVELFDLRFDPEDPADLWALLELSFGREPEGSASPPTAGDELVRLSHIKAEEIAGRLGRLVVGESFARNAVPVVSIATSSIGSYMVTRRLGDNVRRYARYRRAFDDVLERQRGLEAHLDLIIEGVWFMFTADGSLRPEEAALLASLVRRASPETYARICDELADDISWVSRLPRIPEPLRDAFIDVLEVAAAVDARATLRERRLIAHAARVLGRADDPEGLSRMLRDLRDVGVLSDAA